MRVYGEWRKVVGLSAEAMVNELISLALISGVSHATC